jgi:hypothetical protein
MADCSFLILIAARAIALPANDFYRAQLLSASHSAG